MYGYNNWGYGWNYGCCNNTVVHGTDDDCGACADGRIGCGWTTYHNNTLLGGCKRPVMFTKILKRSINGKDVDVLVSDREFFDRLRFDCTSCRQFYAKICCCIEFGDTRPVFIADKDDCVRLLPLETSRNGFIIHADQIQPFADRAGMTLKMTACFDSCNDHVTISNYFRKHAKCDCCEDFYGKNTGCGCGCCEEFEGVDGFVNDFVG